MFRFLVAVASILSVAAFAPAGRAVHTSLNMELVGASGPLGFWDPLKLSAGKDEATINYYRAAELKHGRVAMVASLGAVIQELQTGILPNPAFREVNPLKALATVSAENPAALIQIIIAIAAVEVLGASIELKTGGAGDFKWDPAGLKPSNPEALAAYQTKELNNGRLAMISIAGILLQSSLVENGPLAQIF